MINLLPPAAKQQFTAGRVNALLIRYIWIVLALFVLLAALSGLTAIMLQNVKQVAEREIASNNSSTASLQDVQVRVDTFKLNLDTAKANLDQQTHYSDTLLKISSLMTPGTTISSIALDQSTYGTPVTFQISAKSEEAVISLKQSFQNSTLFSDVHFQSVSIGSAEESSVAGYPVTAQLVVTINKAGA